MILPAESNAAAGQIVGGHFHGDRVTRKDANVVLSHFAGDMGEDVVLVSAGVHLHAKHRVGQRRDDYTLDLDGISFSHEFLCSQPRSRLNPHDLVRDIDTLARARSVIPPGTAGTRLKGSV